MPSHPQRHSRPSSQIPDNHWDQAAILYFLILSLPCSYCLSRFLTLTADFRPTLTKQLRKLEGDGFLHREIYKEIPPKVEYSLTEFGESFIPVLQTMMAWSETYLCPDWQNPYEK